MSSRKTEAEEREGSQEFWQIKELVGKVREKMVDGM